jgi:hypothetical protein
MNTQYTSNLLLPVLYRELPADQLEPIFQALKLDEKLRDEFFRLKEAKQSLQQVRIEPAQSSIDRILAYSRATA